MSKPNGRNGRAGRRSKDRQGPQSESPLDLEPLAAKVGAVSAAPGRSDCEANRQAAA